MEEIRQTDREYIKQLRLFHQQHGDKGADMEIANLIESWRLYDAGEPDDTPVHHPAFDLTAFNQWKGKQ